MITNIFATLADVLIFVSTAVMIVSLVYRFKKKDDVRFNYALCHAAFIMAIAYELEQNYALTLLFVIFGYLYWKYYQNALKREEKRRRQ